MPTIVRFDCFVVDLAAGQLYKHGLRIRLRDQSFQVLQILIEHAGEVVAREALRKALWPGDVFVDVENGLNAAVARLREALGDSAEEPRYIETLARRGYRFIAAVSSAVPPRPGAGDGRTERDGAAARGSSRLESPDPVAYREYVLGRRHLDEHRTSDDFEKARAHLEAAATRSPRFAPAFEALAQLHWWRGYIGLVAPRDAFGAAIISAVHALEIDNSRAETHALLGQIRKQLDYDWSGVERELSRAVERAPDSAFVRVMYATSWLMPQGWVREAITMLEDALHREPLSTWGRRWLGVLLVLSRDWDRAMTFSRAIVELEPAAPWGHWLYGIACRGKGLIEEAIAAHHRAVDASGGWPCLWGWLGLLLGSSGRAADARAILARLEEHAEAAHVPPSSFAWVHLGLGEVDRAFEWLHRAVDERDQLMMPIKSYAFFDSIRAQPRFRELLRKMKLEPD